MAAAADARTFEFAFETPYAWVGKLFGVRPDTAEVEVDDDELRARFGPWQLTTPRHNIRGAAVTGPYGLLPTIGPAHLSFTDRGLTFASNRSAGVCLTFKDPVAGIEPLGWLRHPGLTVTVADPEGLVALLQHSGTVRTDAEDRRDRQAAEDQLHTMATSDLRDLAAHLGIDHPASTSHDELVSLLDDRLDDLEDELLARASERAR